MVRYCADALADGVRIVGVEQRLAECVGYQPADEVHLIHQSRWHVGCAHSNDVVFAGLPDLEHCAPQVDHEPVKGGKMCTINSRAQLRVRTSLLFREAQ